MKRVVQVKLLPASEQAQVLAMTLHACNEAAGYVSVRARELAGPGGRVSGYDLRAVTYGQVKQTVPGAQAAQQVIRKVADAYKTHRSNLKAGNYGRPGTRRHTKAASSIITFRPDAAQPFDARNLSWNHQARTVSIWTVRGRMKGVRFVGRDSDLALLAVHPIKESDLIARDGAFYLHAVIDLPDVPVTEPDGWLGVDLGIVQIAATATDAGVPGRDWSGGAVTARRKRNVRLRKRLQAKGTKSAKRLLKKRSKKETRFVADVNHQVSKSIVTEAKRTGSGIAVENLGGIRARVRLRKPQRVTLHSWAFAQLGQFLAYKAQGAGVAFVQVDPAYTSQTCSGCGHVDKKNRINQAIFACRSCGVSLNADTNAAINIARRGRDGWAAVDLPHAA